ncbi:kinase-like domain-containing protein [Podospora appendiculata]|uniref:non-specific serine/threonine protein kinase n=1 Tax=Podospora appendiculata TaxID=314037 RepID=A0AAE1CC51_9PEZI|nr:kinase-like domain-containing protein [Podospora appendiculata]
MSSPSCSGPQSDDHDASTVSSETSTLEYGQEAFDTFQTRVLDLAVTKLWPDTAAEDMTVERLKGGGYNRIIGLSLAQPSAHGDGKTDYILRIPRNDSARVENEVATLHFIQRRTRIPAPVVVAFDDTDENCLGSPYTLQERIPGTRLLSLFPTMTHQERIKIAEELGGIIKQMLAVRSAMPSIFVPSTELPPIASSFSVAPLQLSDVMLLSLIRAPRATDTRLARPYSEGAPTVTSLFRAERERLLKLDPNDSFGTDLIDKFSQMVSDLEAQGWLVNDHYTIVHWDLAPRNILVNPTDNPQAPLISGMLDWDCAILGPMFMTCGPPLWIWAWSDEDEDEDEKIANNDPSDPEARELKEVFEKAAGPDYLSFAYKPAYRLARCLVRIAIEGVHSTDAWRRAEAMLQEWAEIRNKENKESASTAAYAEKKEDEKRKKEDEKRKKEEENNDDDNDDNDGEDDDSE